MLLSIAIPTYNRANYLDRCLDSITRQIVEIDYQVELLVVDNASTDHTFEIVEKYIKRGFQIKYSKGETNKGIDYNILQCYHLSKGKYVVAFGDDDILYDGVLKRLEKFSEMILGLFIWKTIIFQKIILMQFILMNQFLNIRFMTPHLKRSIPLTITSPIPVDASLIKIVSTLILNI